MGRRPTVNLNLLPRMRAKRKPGGVYYYYEAENRKEIPLGKDYILAVQKWSALHMAKAPVAMTVGWAIEKFRAAPAYTELSKGTRADYGFALDQLAKHFADAPLDQVRPSHLVGYLEHRGKESKHRAQREVNVLGRVFKYARSKDWTTNDPKSAVEMKRLPGRKNVTITDDMLEAVYDQAPQDLKDAIDLAYLIGQRPADVLKMADTDIQDGHLIFRQNKTDAAMDIAVAGDLAVVIARIQARKRKFPVVALALLVNERGRPMTRSMLRSRFEAARTAAGIPGSAFQFRDLRRKAGADLRRQVGLEAAQDLLGHASVVMTEHYTGGRSKNVTAMPTRKKHGKVA